MITFAGNGIRHTSFPRTPHNGGNSARKASQSGHTKGFVPPKVKAFATLGTAFLAACSWVTHSASGWMLKNDVARREVSDTLFPVVNRQFTKISQNINKGFTPDTSMHPYHVDTIKIPENIRENERGSFSNMMTPFFKTPALTPEDIRGRIISLEESRRSAYYLEDGAGVPDYFNVQVKDTLLLDKDGKRHLVANYYSDHK